VGADEDGHEPDDTHLSVLHDRSVPSSNDVIIRASALALHDRANVEMAVAAQEALLVPTSVEPTAIPRGDRARLAVSARDLLETPLRVVL
jgi:hypothetical protein